MRNYWLSNPRTILELSLREISTIMRETCKSVVHDNVFTFNILVLTLRKQRILFCCNRSDRKIWLFYIVIKLGMKLSQTLMWEALSWAAQIIDSWSSVLKGEKVFTELGSKYYIREIGNHSEKIKLIKITMTYDDESIKWREEFSNMEWDQSILVDSIKCSVWNFPEAYKLQRDT